VPLPTSPVSLPSTWDGEERASERARSRGSAEEERLRGGGGGGGGGGDGAGEGEERRIATSIPPAGFGGVRVTKKRHGLMPATVDFSLECRARAREPLEIVLLRGGGGSLYPPLRLYIVNILSWRNDKTAHSLSRVTFSGYCRQKVRLEVSRALRVCMLKSRIIIVAR